MSDVCLNCGISKSGDCDDVAAEDMKLETIPYPLVWSGDLALRLWVFDVIHSNEYVNLLPGTMEYCEEAVRWLRDGKPKATGEKVVPFTRKKPASGTFGATFDGFPKEATP